MKKLALFFLMLGLGMFLSGQTLEPGFKGTLTDQSGGHGSENANEDWGPLTGPWVRYSENPIIAEHQANPGSIIRYKGKLWMIIYSNEKATTRLAVSNDGYDWEFVHEGRPILDGEYEWEGSYAPTKDAIVIDDTVHLY